MKKLKLTLLSFSILVFSLAKVEANKGIKFQHVTLKEAQSIAQKENKLIFIDLYATWCGPCKYLTKSVFVDEDLGEFFNENFISLKLDGEKADGRSLMNKFDLNAYPTLLFINHKGELIKKQVGASGPESIKQLGQDVLHPEETKIYKLRKLYEGGANSNSFLADFILTLDEEGDKDEAERIAGEYMDCNPKIKLEDKNDFTAFVFSKSNLWDPLVTTFLSDIASIKANHDYDLVESKIIDLINDEIVRAANLKDEDLLDEMIAKVYNPFKTVIGKDALSKKEFEEKIKLIYKNN
jgi:thioredoxin-related protein